MKRTIISLPPKTILGYKKNGQPIFNIAGGSEPLGDTGYTGGEPQGDGSGNGGNPAWSEFLEAVPQEFHEKVTPILKKWDEGVQNRFQQVHSEYEPWKPIIGTGVEPGTAQFALQMLNAVQENPEMVWRALGEHYKLFDTLNNNNNSGGSGSGQGQGEPNGDNDPYLPHINELKNQNQLLAKAILEQRQAALEAEEDAKLDELLTGLQNKYKGQGGFNEQFVLAMMQNGMEAEDAVKQYFEFVSQERKKLGLQNQPLIMGSGGGLPSPKTDVTKLDAAGRKNLVQQMLQGYAQQNQ